ncbi:maltase-glucoamylase-like [Branchiostoma lanceolatum]|uniref:maltase-glucoamylase-like n=1 Tax=Branchiostoma lanceolatum TaxID=7740 RepID=UPI003452FEC0
MALPILALLTIALTPLGTAQPRDDVTKRFDCYPEAFNSPLSAADCTARGCVWAESHSPREPKCIYGDNYGYTMVAGSREDTQNGFRVRLTRNADLPPRYASSPDVQEVTLDVEMLSNNMLRFKFYDAATSRYEVPVPVHKPSTPATNPAYTVDLVSEAGKPFGIRVTRRATGTVLWDSSVGGLTFSDQFLQISTLLPSRYVYGFGESEHATYRHKMDYRTWGMFSRDQPPGPPGGDGTAPNLYGVHPYHMCVEDDGNAHSVLLLNSNAMDVTLQPEPALTYRTVGGVLDFYMFLGPSPEDVTQQYTQLIGRPFMPPYWALGFQLCRYGYNTLDRMKQIYDENRQYDIPQDIQYGDIDYMDRQIDFTIDQQNFQGMNDWVQSIRQDGAYYITILDPFISANETDYLPYTRGTDQDVWIKDGDNPDQIMFGKVWPYLPNITMDPDADWDTMIANYAAHTAFPDFLLNSTKQWWVDEIQTFYTEKLQFDGLWIDMNEPANFILGSVNGCSDNQWDQAPYKPRFYGAVLADKTICMNSIQGGTVHYNTHSLYGWSHSVPSQRAMRQATGKRSVIISRSTYPGSGVYAGHWLGDNTSKWPHLHTSIIGMFEFNLFGLPYVGADICGFFDDASPDMCRRWMQLGAFYPFSRNHNGKGFRRQDPAAWNGTIAEASRAVLLTRYRLLPYLYTLFHQAHTSGSTVVRPLMHEFISDKVTWTVDRQFLWGPALLISPVLDEGVLDVTAYVPKARWYDYYTGKEVAETGRMVVWDCDMDCIPLHLRGGYVIPTQEPANTTVFSRRNSLGLLVALDAEGRAEGSLFWDDGDSIDTYENDQYRMLTFTVDQGVLSISVDHDTYSPSPELHFATVRVMGSEGVPDDVTVDGNKVAASAIKTTDGVENMWYLEDIILAMNARHTISWPVPEDPASGAESPKSTPALLFSLITAVLLLLSVQ